MDNAARAREVTFEGSPSSSYRVVTFGRFVLAPSTSDPGPLSGNGHCPRILRLLKIIVALGGENLPLDLLLETVYPGTDPVEGRARLEAQLSRLRRFLGLSRVSHAISIRGGFLSLDRRWFSVDLLDFLCETRLARAALAKGDKQGARAAYERVLAHYHGPFLPEERYSDWAIARRETLERQVAEILRTMSGWALEEGDHGRAESYLRRGLDIDGCDEEAARSLMALCLGRARTNEVIRIYLQVRSTLAATYDLEPEEMTDQLYQRAVRAHPKTCKKPVSLEQ